MFSYELRKLKTLSMNKLPGMVEIFKTDISKKKVARSLVKSLESEFPGYKINIDFADCDKVLRIEGECPCDVDQIERFVRHQDIKIELLS